MLSGRALVNTLNKDVVQLLSHRDLSMLQLGQCVNHHGIVEVVPDCALKDLKVISRELRDALVECFCDLRVRSSALLNYILDVLLALRHIEAELLEVSG